MVKRYESTGVIAFISMHLLTIYTSVGQYQRITRKRSFLLWFFIFITIYHLHNNLLENTSHIYTQTVTSNNVRRYQRSISLT